MVGRRSFLASGGALVAAAALPSEARGSAYEGTGGEALVVGEPCLQAPAETTMGISWSVSGLAKGVVEYADNPEFKDSKKVKSGGYGLVPIDIDALNVRLENLKPSTRYYYRTITTPFTDYRNIYNAKLGEPIVGATHSFQTLGPKTAAHICVFSDTHAQWPVCQQVAKKLKALKPSLAVWNGDATNTTQHKRTAVEIFLNPPIADKDYAADIPIAFESGNHDFRGSWISKKEEVILPRHPAERLAQEWDLKWNFAVRVGDLAVIGMDTGEDKPDDHPKWFGLANFSPYRKAQAAWLERALARPDIAKAKFKVVVCHIPLWYLKETDDDGTTISKNGYAYWMREAYELWNPLMEKAGVQLVIAGHRHMYHYVKPGAGHSWHQFICGGPGGQGSKTPVSMIEIGTRGGALRLRVHDVWTDKVIDEFNLS